jgi:crotonobetainyl-CoA:carnitine CoA-transferase CaiB-like acyl-CoA transferase
MHISGPGNRPTWLRNSAMDCHTGLNLFLGVVLGLYQRRATGTAGRVSTSLLAAASLATSESLLSGPDLVPTPITAVTPDQTGVSPFYRIYELSDGWVAIAAMSAEEQRAFLKVAGATAADDLAARLRHRDVSGVLADLEGARVPAERVALDNRDVFFDRELAIGYGLVTRTQTKPYGWFENPGGFWEDGTGVLRSARPIPDVGEHSVEIMRELGFGDDRVKELMSAGVISEEPLSQPEGRAVNPLNKSLNR